MQSTARPFSTFLHVPCTTASLPAIHPPPCPPAGLCCAALLAHYGYSVTVCESHYLPGGAAHSFEVQGFKFDAGPSFHAGLSVEGKSSNPLKQVLDVLGEKVDCVTYDQVRQGLGGWMDALHVLHAMHIGVEYGGEGGMRDV